MTVRRKRENASWRTFLRAHWGAGADFLTVRARPGEEEPVAPPKPRPANVPTEHLKLVAKDHDFQVFGVLVAPHERSEDSAEDQGHERPHDGGPPAPDMLSDTTGSTVRNADPE